MAKYKQGNSMVVSEFLVGEDAKPVIVLTVDQWREIGEIISEYGCDCGDENDPPCVPCRIGAIIASVKEANDE